MKTKFIGLEGFNEIESLSTKKKRAVKRTASLTASQKTVRFAKRASSYIAKEISTSISKVTSLIREKAKKSNAKKATAKSTLIIDKCYHENRTGKAGEFSSLTKDIITDISFVNNKKYAHSAPSTSRAHTIIKKKAILAVVACLTVVLLSCATVVSALDTSVQGVTVITNTNETVSAKSTQENNYSFNNLIASSTSDEISNQLGTEAYESLVNDSIRGAETAGLFIDGEFIGATSDGEALNKALEQILIDYKADYDDKTTTEFANDVIVKYASFSENKLMSVSEIMSSAEGKFSIALSTDITYTKELPYETKTKYDDTKGTSYEEVTTEGKNGEQLVTIRTTFTDGVQTDAVQTDSKVIKEAVNEVIVKGSNKSLSSSSGSASGSFMWPVPYTHSISSYYEWRWGRMHWGIDIADSGIYGQDIVASDGGTVTFAGYDDSGYGYYVLIDHGNGYSTCYAHCSSLAVSAGQKVSKGQTVGYIGSTGNSTGPHLHFEVRYGSDKLNPLDFVS